MKLNELTNWEDLKAETEERRRRHEARPKPLRLIIDGWFAILRLRDRPSPYKRLRWAYQRARRGWSDGDIVNLDCYLAGVISGSLEQLRKEGHTHPQELTPEQWDTRLRMIITPLSVDIWRAEDESAEDWLKRMEDETKAQQDAIRLLADHWPSLWD